MRILHHFDLLMWLVVKDESDACFPALFKGHIVQAFLASAVVPVRGNNSSQYTKRPDLRRLFRLSFIYQWVMSELQSVSGGGGRTWIPLTHLRHLNLRESDQFIEKVNIFNWLKANVIRIMFTWTYLFLLTCHECRRESCLQAWISFSCQQQKNASQRPLHCQQRMKPAPSRN